MNHPSPPVDWDLADGAERESWLDHVSACPRCRDSWSVEDPSRLFGLLTDFPAAGDEILERETLERLTAGIRREIRPVGPGAWLVRAVAAAVLAAALLVPASAWLFRNPPAETVRAAAFPLADVEVLSTPGDAQVIDLSVGDTQVVMIFDPRLKI